MGNGWVEVRTSAERAEHIQAGASGPWQEFNGTGWVRAAGILVRVRARVRLA